MVLTARVVKKRTRAIHAATTFVFFLNATIPNPITPESASKRVAMTTLVLDCDSRGGTGTVKSYAF